jgi:hypothetical protein
MGNMLASFIRKGSGSTMPLSKIWRFLMKKSINSFFVGGLVLFIAFVIIGCASGPVLGSPTLLQSALNAMPAIPLAGNNLKFQFGGDTWIATNNGANFLAGTFTAEETDDGAIITLIQTHIGPSGAGNVAGGTVGAATGLVGTAAKWVKASGPEIVLKYEKGPPATLTTVRN